MTLRNRRAPIGVELKAAYRKQYIMNVLSEKVFPKKYAQAKQTATNQVKNTNPTLLVTHPNYAVVMPPPTPQFDAVASEKKILEKLYTILSLF